jgi:hypothetical protein
MAKTGISPHSGKTRNDGFTASSASDGRLGLSGTGPVHRPACRPWREPYQVRRDATKAALATHVRGAR